MICPNCGIDNNIVIRNKQESIGGSPVMIRKRVCKGCGWRFNTLETVFDGARHKSGRRKKGELL